MRANLTHFFYKHALLLLLCLFVSTSTVFAVPAWNGWQTKHQPDGTTIVVRQMGDEFYSYWETQDGKLAIQQADGTFVVSSDPLPTPAQASARRRSSPMYNRQPRKAAAAGLRPEKGLAIVVQFQDEKVRAENDNQGFHDLLNKEGYSYNGATGSARDYFIAQSNGKYVPEFDVFGPVTLPHDLEYYGAEGDVTYTDKDGNTQTEKQHDMYMADLVVDAVHGAHDLGCDFSQYDSDNDGYVDIIYFFYAGYSQSEGAASKTIWPHNWNLYSAFYYNCTHGKNADHPDYNKDNLPVLNGKKINDYVCSSEINTNNDRSGIGTFCHEFGHVLGLPDYYDTKYSYNAQNKLTPDNWSIMAGGSYTNESRTPPNYSIYDKYFLGWATPKFLQKNDNKDVVMTTGYDDAYQITGGSELVNWNNTNTVYYIENRQQTGWDTYLPGHGMLVWEVKYDAGYWGSNIVNAYPGEPKLIVYSALQEKDGKPHTIGYDRDPFPGTENQQTFTKVEGCALTDINEGAGNITFKYNDGGACRTVVTDIKGCKFSTIACASENLPLYLTFAPESEYDDITSLTVQVGSTTLTKGTDYVLSEDHKTLTVYSAAIKAHSGDITITATWEKVIMTYQFSMSIANCTYPSDGTCRLGEPLVLKITPDEGYTLRDGSCWGIVRPGILGGLIYGTDYTYNESTNELTVFSVPGNLYINPMPRALERWYADGNLYNEEIITSTSLDLPSPAPGNCSNGRKFVGWCKDADYHNLTIAPTYVTNSDSRDEDKPASYYAVYATNRVLKIADAQKSINDATATYLPRAYGAEKTFTINSVSHYAAQFYWDEIAKVMKWRGADDANGAGYLYNDWIYASTIHSIVITYSKEDKYRNISLKVGSAKNPTGGRSVTPTVKGNVYTFDCTDGDLCEYFVLTNGDHEAIVERIDVNLTPESSSNLNYSTKCNETPAYVVVFYDEDGTKVSELQYVEEGKAAIAPTLVKDCYNLAWDKDFSHVTKDLTVTADWRPKSGYKWSITSNDESKGTIVFDPEPTCTDQTLHFSAKPKDGFGFVEWSDGVKDATRTVTLTKDTALVAKFAKLWKVDWYDDTKRTKLLATSYVPDGEMPVYPLGTPTRDDPESIYAFNKWIPDLTSPVTADGWHVATYTFVDYRYYTVTFKDENGTVLGEDDDVRYEWSASAPKVDARDCYTYSWDKDFSKVTEDMTVNLVWTPKSLGYTFAITSEDESKGTVTVTKQPTCEDPVAEFRADGKNGYVFLKWSDDNTDNPRTLTVNSNTELTASWIKKWTITWKNWDGRVLDVSYVDDGVTPRYSGPTPTREPDAEYTYDFYNDWTPTIEKATKDAEYTAVFTPFARKYTVIFQYEDGTEIRKQEVRYGEKATEPNKYNSSLVIPDCQKVTWDKDFSCITSDLVVTAHFVSKIPKYELKTSDETQGTVKITREPTCSDFTPYVQFEAVAKDGAKFLWWSDDHELTYYMRTIYLTKDTVVTAVWAKFYTIKWMNGDEVLETDENVAEGETPEYNGTTPTKAADEGYTYKFKGWEPEIKPVEADQVYTATFTPKPKEFFVTFVGLDGWQLGELQMVKYGEPAIEPTYDPVITEDCKTWKWDTDFSSIKENVQIHAVYVDKPLPYTYSIESSNTDQGTVRIIDEPTSCWAVMKFEATPNAGYEFLKWSDGDKENPRYLQVTKDTTITALWEKTATFYTITWMNGDVVLKVDDQVAEGETPVYKGVEPTKAADAQYTYTFDGWDPVVVPATANATYTAKFKETLNKYTVTFVDEDGKTVLKEATEYEYGATPEKPADPTKTADAEYTYTFAGWSPAVAVVTGDATYTATYNKTKNKYTVTFVDEDGTTVLKKATEYEYGATPELPSDPSKEATAQYTYTFTGWSPTVVAVTGNATYKATYKATLNQYTVTFVDEDGKTVLGSGKYDYGVIPTYSGATPTKTATAQYTYTFAGWSPEVEAVAGNVTYTATYEATLNEYTITFVDEDGKTILQSTEVAYGTKPEYKGETPTKAADAENTYAFSGWTPEIVAVTGKATYTATYKATPIVVEPVEVAGETDIEKLKPTATTDIEVTPTGHLTVSTSTTIHSLTLEYSMDNYESGHAQLSGIKNLILDEIEVKMSFPTPIGPLDGQWFAIAVPFAVSMATGIRYEGADKPAVSGTDFIVEEYDGALRAATQRGWKSVKADATLYPGRMYMFSAAKHATWYLKAADPKSLDEPTSVNMSAYVSTIGAHHSGWNGIANTLLTCASGEAKDVTYATMYNNKAGAYLTQPTDKYVFGAAVPFFVQTVAAVTLNFTDESASSAPLRAPQSTPEGIVALTLTDAASAYTDRAYWSLKADKEDTYLIGHDLQKMQVANAGVPQVSILAYGMRLSAHEVPFDGESQTIAVNLYAPAEGAYTVGLSGVPDGLSVLLTKNGNLLWDITSTPFVADLQAGDNSGYALSIRRIKEIGTGVNNTSAELNVQKVLLNDRIYILRDGKTYVITGECVNK